MGPDEDSLSLATWLLEYYYIRLPNQDNDVDPYSLAYDIMEWKEQYNKERPSR